MFFYFSPDSGCLIFPQAQDYLTRDYLMHDYLTHDYLTRPPLTVTAVVRYDLSGKNCRELGAMYLEHCQQNGRFREKFSTVFLELVGKSMGEEF